MRIATLSLSDPDGPSHGGTLRTRSLAEALERAGHEVHRVFPATAATTAVAGTAGIGVSRGERRLPGPLRRLKRHLLPMPTRAGARNPALAKRLAELDPDVLVVAALSQLGFRDAVPRARLWLDMLDVWSEVALREVGVRSGPAALTSRLQVARLRRVEDRAARDAAAITVVGWRDGQTMAARGADVAWLPTTLPDSSFREAPARPVPRVAGLLGNFHFWPNRDAYGWLVRTWAPVLTAAGWSVVVAGLGADELPTSPLVRNLGPLDDVAGFYEQVGLVLAPVALGGGMKVKVVEALAHGRPVLATEQAAEGLPPQVRGMVLETTLAEPDLAAVERDLPSDRLRRLEPYRAAHLDAAVARLTEQLAGDRG